MNPNQVEVSPSCPDDEMNKVYKGRKITEAGFIPQDWEASPLGELVEIHSGESPSKFQFLTEGTPYFKVEQLNNGAVFADSTPYFIKSSKKVLAGSVIFPKRGASILSNKIRVLMHDSFMDTNLMALTCLHGLNGLYLYNQLTYRGLDSVADTTSIPQINNKHIIPYIIPLPNENEQTAIANALSDVDALIQELEKLIAKKQAIKTATMQQLLTGRTRLPQFAHHPDGSKKGYKPSELGEIPEDWEVMSIGTIADVKTGPFGSALHEKDYVQSGTPIITVEHLGEMGITYQNLPLVSESDKARLRAYKLSEGDIVFSRVGSIDRNALVKGNEDGWLFSGRLLRIKLKSQKNIPSYLSFYFHTLPFKRRVVEVAVGQTMPSLNTTILKNLLVVLPELKLEQAAISEFLSHIDEEIQAIEQRLNKTRQIKQGMMQELLTGKTRLVKPAGAA